MDTQALHARPGTPLVLNLKRGTLLIPRDGPLLLHYREHALAWLPQAAPLFTQRLPEGHAYVLPADALVQLANPGARPVVCLFQPPPTLAARLRAAWHACLAIAQIFSSNSRKGRSSAAPTQRSASTLTAVSPRPPSSASTIGGS